MKAYFKKYRRYIIGGQFFKLAEAILELLVPLIVAGLINRLGAGTDKADILRSGALMLGIGIIGFACALICQYSAAKTSESMGRDLRNDLFRIILDLPPEAYGAQSVEALVVRLTADVEKVQIFTAMLIRLFVRAPFLFAGAFIMCFILNPALSLIILAAILMILFAAVLLLRRVPAGFRRIQENEEEAALHIREHVSGITTIRSLQMEEAEIDRFTKGQAKRTELSTSIGTRTGLVEPAVQWILYMGNAATLVFGAALIQRGIILKGTVVAYFNYLTAITVVSVVIIQLLPVLMQGMAAMRRINEVLALRTEVVQGAGLPDMDGKTVWLVQGLSYRYSDKAASAVSDLNLHIKQGEHIGIIGGTGSGKSTLLHLLCGRYTPTNGTISFYEADPSGFSSSVRARCIAFCLQRGKPNTGTLDENIAMGNPTANPGERLAAARLAGLDELLATDGMDHPICAEGNNLSGGQKQRVMLARTLVRTAPVYCFDDAFSALDGRTAERVVRGVHAYLKGKTLLLTAQRIRTVRHCDRILVLSEGRAVACDTHERLMKNCALYQRLAAAEQAVRDA
ncbi:MAG: ABC transporter ATP-binding protein [Eubacteriales bacterium]|nr:ABC transporter ATP-binding protein [Eubacteriales bacterium]